jgi:hypothetical protein
MRFLGFYPETVAARVRAAAAPPRLLTLAQSVALGAGGFCLVIMAVMAVVAVADKGLRDYLGQTGSHAVYALLIILLAGGVFRRLVIAPNPAFRVYLLFAAALILYDVAWAAVYRPFPNLLGEWLGSVASGTGLGLVFATVFDAPKQAVRAIVVLCVTSAAGYFSGRFLNQFIHQLNPGIVGPLVWGAAYGLGMGTGLGYALHACQEPARQRLNVRSPAKAQARSIRRTA